MQKENIPSELMKLITEEELILFKELQIKIQEINSKTNLTRLIQKISSNISIAEIINHY